VIDVLGYYSTEQTDANGLGLLFTPLAHPVRLLETRSNPSNLTGCFKPNAPLNGNQVYTQLARGLCDKLEIPASARAVVGNATVVLPQADGYLTLWPSAATQPTVAASNFRAGQVFNRYFAVGLGTGDGAFKVFTSARTDLVTDLSGFFSP
jgi:serine protease